MGFLGDMNRRMGGSGKSWDTIRQEQTEAKAADQRVKHPGAPRESMVKTYHSGALMAQDVPRMTAAGWTIAAQATKGFAPKKFVVTWTRDTEVR